MGRRKNSDIQDKFCIQEEGDVSSNKKKMISICKMCGWKQAYNATRMDEHLKKCNRAQDDEDSDLESVIDTQSDVSNTDKNTDTPQPVAKIATPSPKQASKRQMKMTSFLDNVSSQEQAELDGAFARAALHKGLPLDVFEDPYMKLALKKCRPGYKPLTSFKLGETQLKLEYDSAKKFNEEKVMKSKCVALMLDGWTNINGKGLINFLLACPYPVLVKVIHKGSDRETGKYLAEQVDAVIKDVENEMEEGEHKVFVVVTDNASAMRKMWEILSQKHPHITCIGCAPHCLNLFIKDILKLQSLKTVYSSCKKIIKWVKNSHSVLATFENVQKQKYGSKACTLKLPPSTRFGYVVLTFDSVVRNKSALQETALDDSLAVKRDLKLLLCDEDFWSDLNLMLKLLRPIARGIALLESNDATLSAVVEVFADTYKTVTSDEILDDFSVETGFKIKDIALKRKNFLLKSIHYAANILDPRYCGKTLNDDLRIEGIEFIRTFAENLKLDVSKLMTNLVEFRTKTGFFQSETLWDSAPHVHPASWWEGLCTEQAVTPLAIKLLSLPPSAAGCERNWSSFGKIHSKPRNRLKAEKAEKLVTVQAYLHTKLKMKMNKRVAKVLEFKPVNYTFPSETLSPPTRQVVDESSEDDDDYDYDSDKSELSISSGSGSDGQSDSDDE